MALDHFGFLIIELRELRARVVVDTQELVQLGMQRQIIAAIGALDEQRHHEHRERRDGIPVECISAECQPQRGVDDDDKKGGGMSRLCVPKTLFELMT